MLCNDLTTKALRTLGVVAPGEPLSAVDAQTGFDAVNDLLDGWAAIRLTIFQTLRNIYALSANKGSPTNPYTLGPGGNLSQVRPLWIPNAEIQVATTSPPFEYPLTVLRGDPYARTSLKALTSALPRDLYCDFAFPTSGASKGLANLFLFPVPDGTLPLSLVLYVPTPLTAFADQNTTQYTFPPGYAEALRYQLAIRLAPEYEKTVSPVVAELAKQTFAVIQRPNARMPVLRCDAALMGGGGYYDWRTGEMR